MAWTTGAKEEVPDLRTPTGQRAQYESNEHMAYVTDTRGLGTSIGQRFTEFRATILDRMTRAKLFRTTSAELNNLSDRDLADLGIARSSIKSIAMEAAYGK